MSRKRVSFICCFLMILFGGMLITVSAHQVQLPSTQVSLVSDTDTSSDHNTVCDPARMLARLFVAETKEPPSISPDSIMQVAVILTGFSGRYFAIHYMKNKKKERGPNLA